MYYTKDKINLPPHEVEQAVAVSVYNFSKLDKAKKYMLSFSGGKDSIILLEMALASGFAPEIYHQYFCEGLSFNEEVFEHYRARGITINQVEGGIAQRMKKADLLCINKVFGMKATNSNPMAATEALLQQQIGFDYNLIGIKLNDSPQRRLTINKHGWIQENAKKAYPIYHWTDKQIFWHLYENNLPVNRAYQMFGRSMDVINWGHIEPLREQSPPNSLDYFVIFCFKSIQEKQDWCIANKISPDAHAVKGEQYQIDDV